MEVEPDAETRCRRRLRRAGWWVAGFVLLVFACYGWLAWRYWHNLPRPTVDYTAEWNAEVAKVPVDQRAWPKYRPLATQLLRGKYPETFGHDFAQVFTDADVAGFVRKQEPLMRQARQAARLPSMGYPYNDVVPEEDFEFTHPSATPEQLAALPRSRPSEFPHMLSVRVEAMAGTSDLRECLAIDALLAGRERDSSRAMADVSALFGLAHQLRRMPWLIGMFRGLATYREGLQAWGMLMQHEPPLLTAERLRELERQAGAFDFDLRRALADERKNFLDIIQRVYTDDGHGDGFFAVTELSPALQGHEDSDRWLKFKAPLSTVKFPSRRAIIEAYDWLADLQAVALNQPYWLRDASEFQEALASLKTDPSYRLATLMFLDVSTMHAKIETAVQQANAILLASAALRYRLGHAVWPATAEELVPAYLDTIPTDRLTGEPLRYAVVDGRPRIYSIGNDGKDDGGKPAVLSSQPAVSFGTDGDDRQLPVALEWRWELGPADEQLDGDWVLWPVTVDDPFARPETKKIVHEEFLP